MVPSRKGRRTNHALPARRASKGLLPCWRGGLVEFVPPSVLFLHLRLAHAYLGIEALASAVHRIGEADTTHFVHTVHDVFSHPHLPPVAPRGRPIARPDRRGRRVRLRDTTGPLPTAGRACRWSADPEKIPALPVHRAGRVPSRNGEVAEIGPFRRERALGYFLRIEVQELSFQREKDGGRREGGR